MEWKDQGSEQGSLSFETYLQSLLSYRALGAHAGDYLVHVPACLEEQLMRPFGTKSDLFWSVLFKMPGGLCVCLQRPPWSKQKMKSTEHNCPRPYLCWDSQGWRLSILALKTYDTEKGRSLCLAFCATTLPKLPAGSSCLTVLPERAAAPGPGVPRTKQMKRRWG